MDDDTRKRAREICTLIGRKVCADTSYNGCNSENCYVFELIERGQRRG